MKLSTTHDIIETMKSQDACSHSGGLSVEGYKVNHNNVLVDRDGEML